MNTHNGDLRLASLERDGYFLESGEELHANAPATFEIPDREDREAVEEGRIVKLVFKGLDGDAGIMVERMWVIVRERRGDFYVGSLDNIPAFLVRIKVGEPVVFRAEHIIDIWAEQA